jgi:hypothetical protein
MRSNKRKDQQPADHLIVAEPIVWRGAALERTQRPRDILSSARKAKYGVKQAAPANYRTRCFAL